MTSSSTPPQKISLSSLSDLKSTTDDTIPQLLTALPAPYAFTQQHHLANTRLALGYAALAIAGTLFYVDWKHGGWEVTRPYTLAACTAYFILNAALTYWIWVVDRGTVFSGVLTTEEGERRVTAGASAGGGDGKVYQDNAVEGRFSQWFNIHGYIDKPALKSWLAKNIDVVVIGAAPAAGTSGTDVSSVGTKRGKARKKA
ncbi:hypothetical protein DV736_g2691, partial [Chaetothyriales sp. CBS 134916]